MLDDRTILYASPEPGTQTELINPNEIAAMAKKPAPRKPDHEDDHPMLCAWSSGRSLCSRSSR